MNRKADPVTIEVVRNLLMSIAEETNTVIIKSAYSTNIKELTEAKDLLVTQKPLVQAYVVT